MIIIAKEKHEAEEQLEETMPALLEAQQGLDTLKAADITEMRSFVNPVDALRLIGYCMLIYLGHSSISWKDVINENEIADLLSFRSGSSGDG